MGSKKLLDHGYIEVVEHWGSDERIIEAARMSTGKGFLGWGPECSDCNGRGWFLGEREEQEPCDRCHGTGKAGDEKLLKYLWDNKHATPFEMAGLVIEVQAPIMVFREWHRHRTQSYNEMSGRYVPLPDVNYVPSVERLLQQASGNKQAASTGAQLTGEQADTYRAMLMVMYKEQEELYQVALKHGVPKELARLHLPVGRYSKMRASANLRNWLAFLTLRQASNAQWEIRQYADALNEMLVSLFPRTMELFNA
jgi:thymidylate synthase (FAD)